MTLHQRTNRHFLQIGAGKQTFIIAEIGINHNGSLELAKGMIDAAAKAGCDAVKFQKRTPELCVPKEQWHVRRSTPWGEMTYIDYRYRVEFGFSEFAEIDKYCKEKGILWFASCWDIPSVEFMNQFDPPMHKAPSAMLINYELLRAMKNSGKPLMLSTGMSTMTEIESAINLVGEKRLLLAHSTSSYPCALEELNLRMIYTLRTKFPRAIIGYSGHESGVLPSLIAVSIGAHFVERHITLDKKMWGTDQSASLEINELDTLVQEIRKVPVMLGDGIKKVYDSERKVMEKLRPFKNNIEILPFALSRKIFKTR